MSKPLAFRTLRWRNFIDRRKIVASEVRGDSDIFVGGELIQSELSIVHEEYPIIDLSPVAKHLCSEALGECPYVIPTLGEIEVGIVIANVSQELLMKDGRLGEVVWVIVDQKAAAIGRYIEEVCFPGVEGAVVAGEKKAMERVLRAVEVSSAVWIPDLGWSMGIQSDLIFVKDGG